MAVLRILAEDFVPETLAAADSINGWLAENKPETGTPAVGRLAQAAGTATFVLRGDTIEALAQPHRFYLLQRVQDDYASLSETEKSAVYAVLSKSGMTAILDASLNRRIERADNLEVWV
jgi:hypothetical protein